MNYTNASTQIDLKNIQKPNDDDQETEPVNSSNCCCNHKEWNWYQWTVWSFLFLTSLLMCSLAAPYFSFSDSVETYARYKKEKYWVRLHIIPCFFVMLISCHQICGPLRRKYINIHRWFGRVYVVCCIFGCVGGLYMATNAGGGFATRLSFTFIGVLWLICTFMGFYYIRLTKKKNETEKEKIFRISQHRIWMLRSFALMIAVAMFRYWLPLFKDGFGYGAKWHGEDITDYENEQEYQEAHDGFYQAFCAASWFCWTFNLTVLETYFWYQSIRLNSINK